MPFDVPQGTTAVRVKYCFDQPEASTGPLQRHTLDMGIYDGRDVNGFFDASHLRGWGGSSHPDVTVSAEGFRTEAQYKANPKGDVPGRTTRGFRPGAPQPGEWAVELGLAAIQGRSNGDADGKVGWRVEIALSSDPAYADEPYAPAPYDTTPAKKGPDGTWAESADDARRRHVASWSGDRGGPHRGHVKVPQSPARSSDRGTVGARRAWHRPRRAQRRPAAARPPFRARYFHGEPRDRRRHDGEQLQRCAVGPLRQDDRSRDRARRRAVGRIARRRFVRSTDDELDDGLRGDSLERGLPHGAASGREHAAEIERRFPRCCAASAATTSTSSCPTEPFNLAKLMVGSEGTLGVVLEAKAQACAAAEGESGARGPVRRSAGGARGDAARSWRTAVGGRGDGPLHPRSHAKQNAKLDPLRQSFIAGDPAALLCVEFYARSRRDLPPRLDALERDLAARRSVITSIVPSTPTAQARIWTLREAALGLSMAMKGDAKSLSFVEDTAVASREIARLHRAAFSTIVREHGTTAGVYAHASVGCLHVRPVVNLKTAAGVASSRRSRTP